MNLVEGVGDEPVVYNTVSDIMLVQSKKKCKHQLLFLSSYGNCLKINLII